MCTPNYWVDIVETRHSHTYPDRPEDIRWAARRKRNAGLPLDAPYWLYWRATYNPPSDGRRDSRREARNKMNFPLRNAIANGWDLEDLVIETRASRLDDWSRWY